MDPLRRALAALIGEPARLPPSLAHRFPELARLRLRRGGLPVRVAGWALGRPTVAAITLWRTIFVAPEVPLEAELLLHELRHVHQFEAATAFPVLYLWESIRRGYHANRYEADARAFAEERLRASPNDLRRGEV
ncbi:MAG TPA: hypothetical protein VF041_12580 [Gemmatimonadaceae bacterium]